MTRAIRAMRIGILRMRSCVKISVVCHLILHLARSQDTAAKRIRNKRQYPFIGHIRLHLLVQFIEISDFGHRNALRKVRDNVS
jgi:hypothetical protein